MNPNTTHHFRDREPLREAIKCRQVSVFGHASLVSYVMCESLEEWERLSESAK